MLKILMIEDESAVISFVKKGLTEENYSVSVAFDGEMGIDMALEQPYDLILLDIMLPKKNGIEVCKELREKKIQTPILFLTALESAENIALGLNMGGDDYLAKPFKFVELNARIKALLRRADNYQFNATAKNIYTIEDLIVDNDSKTVSRGGTQISLTATEYRLLLALVKNKGKVLSRVDLLEQAWDINFNMGTNVVDVYINYLRKKIDADREVKLIQTVIGMGYIIKGS